MTRLSEIIQTYIAEILPRKRPKTQVNQRHQLEFWSKHLGEMNISEITPMQVIKVRGMIQASDATKNIYMAALRHLFTMAIKEFGVASDNPLLKISNLKAPRERVRYLSNKEFEDLLIACKESANSYLYLVVLLALGTGARKMEIMNLTWSNVDIDRQLLYLHTTKNGELATLPIPSKIMPELLQHLTASKTALLFPSSRDSEKPIDLRHPFKEALKRAGIKDFRFHDQRHTFASYLAMNDTPLNVIAELMRHKSYNMVKKYAHLSTGHKSKVINEMADKIFK
jgi:integrase